METQKKWQFSQDHKDNKRQGRTCTQLCPLLIPCPCPFSPCVGHDPHFYSFITKHVPGFIGAGWEPSLITLTKKLLLSSFYVLISQIHADGEGRGGGQTLLGCISVLLTEAIFWKTEAGLGTPAHFAHNGMFPQGSFHTILADHNV